MQIVKNKTAAIAIAILLILLAAPVTMQIHQTNAQTTRHIPSYLYVSVAPNPVGVGQTEFISLFFTKPISGGGAGFFQIPANYQGMTLNIVRPDGTNQTMGPYTADLTGGVGGIEFVPDKVGNYTVQAFYPGQNLTSLNFYLDPAVSPPATFTVQQEEIPTYSGSPLPTQYWSRPIYATNYGWQNLGGNWWGLGKPPFMNTGGYDATGNNFNPYSQAPNTAHIMWTKPTQFGGQVGGPIASNQESQYTSTSILYRQFEPIIINGIIFYDWYPNVPTAKAGWIAVDLRTGQVVWTKNTTDTLAFGQVLKFHTVQEYGSQSWLWALSADNSKLNLYDPFSGTYIASVTGLPSTLIGLFGSSPAGLYDGIEPNIQGSVLIYWNNGGNLTMWNSTKMMVPDPTSFFASTIRPSGNIAFSLGIQWSVPLPTTINNKPIDPALGISGVTDKAILVTSYPQILPTFLTQFGASYAIEVAYDSKTGQQLWAPVNRTLVEFHELDLVGVGEGYYVRHDKDTNQAYGYSLLTGQQLWGPVQLQGNALSHLQSQGAIAYGKVYIWDFGGFVSAIYLNNGTIAWTFSRGTAGYDTPYGVYPIWGYGSQSIADGKLFLSEGRMYDPPLFPNAHKLALNCTDGSLVWSALGFYARDTSAIADGYLLGWNSYDGQIYAWGKGPSKMTVAAPDPVAYVGAPMIISGTVTDISAGTTQATQAVNFPDGVPCVSDDSMAGWMEFVYMQQPCPANVTGVDVTLDAIDPNNNFVHLGTVTSDTIGTFGYAWITPNVPGKYTIIATFAGSESYYASYAETYAFVQEAPAATPTPTPAAPLPPYEMYTIGTGVAIIIAVVIVGILLLRKRP